MTLGCLAHYRRLGIGSRMIQHIMDLVEKDGQFESIFLHVQVDNEDAINLYIKFGFEVIEIKEQYYEATESGDAFLLEKNLRKTNDKQEKNQRDIYNFNSRTFDTPSDAEVESEDEYQTAEEDIEDEQPLETKQETPDDSGEFLEDWKCSEEDIV